MKIGNWKLKICFLGLGLALMAVGFFYFTQKASASWFNESWLYRKAISVANAGILQTNYQVSFTVDTAALITAGKLQSSCNDIRVTDQGGNLLPYWIETGTSGGSTGGGCNATDTKIWTKIPYSFITGATVYLYYGNSTAPGLSDGNKVFEFFDDFSASTPNSTKWTTTGSPTSVGGELTLSNGQKMVSTSLLSNTDGSRTLGMRAKTPVSVPTASYLGFSNTNTLTSNPYADDSAQVMLGNEPTYMSYIGSSNLISYHKLEETTSTDTNQFKPSGYFDTGKLSQAVSVYGNAAGTVGSYLTFNRGAQISGSNYEHFNSYQGTISFWFKPSWSTASDTGRTRWLFDNRNTGGDSLPRVLKWADGNIGFGMSGAENIVASNNTITSGNWYHMVIRWDSKNTISGSNYACVTLNGTTSCGQTSTFTAGAPGSWAFIGSHAGDGVSGSDSLIDDFAIYDRVLTTAEIATLYGNGTTTMVEAGSVADSSLKFYAKMNGTGTLSPVTYNGGSSASKMTAKSTELTGGTNLLADGNMETAGVTNWTASANTTASKTTSGVLYDAQSLKINIDASDGGSGNHYASQAFTLSANSNYYFSGWYNGANTGNDIIIQIYDGASANKYCISPGNSYFRDSSATTWKKFECAFKTSSETSFTVRLWTPQDTVGYYVLFDNVTLTPNLVDNGGMEGTYAACSTGTGTCAPGWDGFAGGTFGMTNTAHSGTEAQTVTSSGRQIIQRISITSGNSYLVSMWIRRDTGTGWFASYIDNCTGDLSNIPITTTYQRFSYVCKASATGSQRLNIYPALGDGPIYVDDVSLIPLDNTALSLKAWAPVIDTSTNTNDLSVQGALTGVASGTGKYSNGYTFDGSTGYLRQKTYVTNIGTLSYGTNALTDTGQTFTSYKATPATYMIVVTNSDNTTSWGYIGTTSGATIVDVFTTKVLATAGWNGTSPTGKTPVGYEIRKTDYQITGSFSVGLWYKGTLMGNRVISKEASSNVSFLLYDNVVGGIGRPRISISDNGTANQMYTANVDDTKNVDDNNWHFVVGVYNTTGPTLKIYFDGVDLNSPVTGSVNSVFDSYAPFMINGDVNTVGTGTGTYDSPFILNTALTANQIKALYDVTKYNFATTNEGSNSFGDNTYSVTANTSYHKFEVSEQSSAASFLADALAATTSPTNYPNENSYIRLENADATNTVVLDYVYVRQSYSSEPSSTVSATEEQSPGPVGYWKFDDPTFTPSGGTAGQAAKDSSSSKNDGVLGSTVNVDVNDPTWTTEDQCISGKCLYFAGGSSYVNLPRQSLTSTAFTVSAWFRTNSTDAGIYTERDSGNLIAGQLYISSGKLSFIVRDSSGNAILAQTAAATYGDNKWHHAVGVRNGTTGILYVDGVQVSTNTNTNVSSAYTVGTYTIGSYLPTGGYLNGFIDEPKIYPYARTAAQIKTDYNAGKSAAESKSGTGNALGSKPQDWLSNGLVGYWKMEETSWSGSSADVLDASGNGNNGTASCTGGGCTKPTGGAAGKFGNGGLFDGSEDYVDTGTYFSSFTNAFSFSFWVNPNTTQVCYADVFGNHNDNHTGISMEQNWCYNNLFSFGYGDGSAWKGTGYVQLTANTWQHVVGVKDSNTCYFYLNGVQSNQGNCSTPVSPNSAYNFKIAGSYHDGRKFGGSIDDFRAYNRALSPKEVSDLYNFAPGPVVNLKMDENTGTSTLDNSGYSHPGTLNGNPVWAIGKYGSGVKLDGTGDNVSVNDFSY